MDCERTLEYLLWKIHFVKTKEEFHEFLKSMIEQVHWENMKKIDSLIPVVRGTLTVQAPKDEIKA